MKIIIDCVELTKGNTWGRSEVKEKKECEKELEGKKDRGVKTFYSLHIFWLVHVPVRPCSTGTSRIKCGHPPQFPTPPVGTRFLLSNVSFSILYYCFQAGWTSLYVPLFFLFLYTFFECLCSLLWTLGGTCRNESLLYIAELYLSYYSINSSLNQWSLLRVIITSHLKRSRIATPPSLHHPSDIPWRHSSSSPLNTQSPSYFLEQPRNFHFQSCQLPPRRWPSQHRLSQACLQLPTTN